MKFPAYVPAAVQQYITVLLHGDGRSLAGWAAAAKHPDFEWIVPTVAFLRRFEKKDELIEEMFSYLNEANLSDADKKRFVNAAWAALTDYGKYRDALKRANVQRQGIAEKAEELAQLLRDISGHGLFDTPMEFYDVRTLLRETNSSDLTWPYNRRQLLGEPNEPTSDKVAPEDVTVIVDRRVEIIISEATKPDPATRLRDDIAYAWGISPSLSELLDTVAKAARNYEPRFYGRIGAAVEKREGNIKTNYLRAFGYLLVEARIEATADVLNAMACMATVAINDEDVEVSCDDVKQALGLKRKGKRKDTGAAG